MISEFKGKYSCFSNFWPCKIHYINIEYPSVEHAYQAQKIKSKLCQRLMAEIKDPGEVKRLGRKLPIRKDWELIKESIMDQLVFFKFKKYEDLQKVLLDTGDEKLQEGNLWHDTFWGVDLRTGEGKNLLGIILMQIRHEIQVGV
jgi:ribA/ribD-fused uncharacterized protein